MKAFCLGGAGKICREAINDLVRFSDFERITVADVNLPEAREVASWLDDPRVDCTSVDIMDFDETVGRMKGYDIIPIPRRMAPSLIGRDCGHIPAMWAFPCRLPPSSSQRAKF